MREVIYRIFVMIIFYAILGFLFNIFFPKLFWIFSLIFLAVSAAVVWSATQKNSPLDIRIRELDERKRELDVIRKQLDADMEASRIATLAENAELQKKKDEARRLMPIYKSEYMNSLKSGNKVLAYELGARYYSTSNLVECRYGNENDIAQRVKNEIDIYS